MISRPFLSRKGIDMAVTKRYVVPKFWPIEVKAKKYVVSPVPGPHNKMTCIPLGVVLRDMFHYARTMNEAKEILNKKFVKINGTIRKEHGFPVGLMDVIDVDGDFYRVLPGKKEIQLFKITAADANVRLAKIKNKTHVKKKKIQLNLHDGSNILVEKDDFKTSDVIVIDIEHNLIKETIRFEKGSLAIVTAGNNTGLVGTIESIDKHLRTVVMAADKKKSIVPIKYVFVIGHDKPVVSIGE